MPVPFDRTSLTVLPCLLMFARDCACSVAVVGVVEQAIAWTHTSLPVPSSWVHMCLLLAGELRYE